MLPLSPLAAQGASAHSLDSVQVYLIEGEPLTLIDAGLGTPESLACLESALDELGYVPTDIERVVLTHAHRDHLGGIQMLRDAGASIECCVHEDDVASVEIFDRAMRLRGLETVSLFREYGVAEEMLESLHRDRLARQSAGEAECRATSVERVLRETDRIGFKDFDLVVQHSPGHTPGHLLLEDEKLGLLFTGDQVMAQAIPNAENHYLTGLPDPADPTHRRPRFRGLLEMRKSLRRLRGQSFRTLLPGYGGMIAHPDRAIRETLLYYDVRTQRIERGLKHLAAMVEEVTVNEIWKALHPNSGSLAATESELLLLIGAIDCLEEDGLVRTTRRPDGVLTHNHC